MINSIQLNLIKFINKHNIDLINLAYDGLRFRYLLENEIVYKPANYDGNKNGRHDLLWFTENQDLRNLIDQKLIKEIEKLEIDYLKSYEC